MAIIKIISVKEELPPIGENVIAIADGFLGVAYYDGKNWYNSVDKKIMESSYTFWCGKYGRDITHWILF